MREEGSFDWKSEKKERMCAHVLRTAQVSQVWLDCPMGILLALPSRFVMPAPASIDSACSLAAPLRDARCVDVTSVPRGGVFDFFSWSDAVEQEMQCTWVGPRLLGGAPKLARRPAVAVRKRPASSSANTACLDEAPTTRKRAFKESDYCKNESCVDRYGKRRKKQTGLTGYCWTCGPLFAPGACAKAKEKISQRAGSATSAWCTLCRIKYAQKRDPSTGLRVCKSCLTPNATAKAKASPWCALCHSKKAKQRDPSSGLRVCKSCLKCPGSPHCFYCLSQDSDVSCGLCDFSEVCPVSVFMCSHCLGLWQKRVCHLCWRKYWAGGCFQCQGALTSTRSVKHKLCTGCCTARCPVSGILDTTTKCFYCASCTPSVTTLQRTYAEDCNGAVNICDVCVGVS